MFFSKAIIVFVAAATAVVANPLINRDSNSTTCSFVVTPTPDQSLDVLDVDINFGRASTAYFLPGSDEISLAVGHTVGEEFIDHTLTVRILTHISTLHSNDSTVMNSS